MNTELIGISFSPWSEKAKWALDHHRVPYNYSEHLVLFGMPSLRLKLCKPFGDVTVPALIHKNSGKTRRCFDSFEIAEFAEEAGHGAKLFPKEFAAAIKDFNDLSEKIMDAGRALVSSRLPHDVEAAKENLPPFIPKSWRNAMTPLVKFGVAYLDHEFKMFRVSTEERQKELREALNQIRSKLNGGTYLLGNMFTYADITVAAALQFISPVDQRYIRLGPASAKSWKNPEIAEEFADLVRWRDELYAKHRAASARVHGS